jgi:hypothetical protein
MEGVSELVDVQIVELTRGRERAVPGMGLGISSESLLEALCSFRVVVCVRLRACSFCSQSMWIGWD